MNLPFALPNPIPAEINDPKEQAEKWQEYNLIPYYGANLQMSHGYLDLLKTLTQMSETFVSVMRDRSQFTFGLNLDVVGRVIPGLASEPIVLERSLKEKFALWLTDMGLPLVKILELSQRAELHLEQSGNTYLRIKKVTVGKTTKYFLDVVHYKHVAYVWSEDPGERFVIVSKHLGNHRLMIDNKPQLLRVTEPCTSLRWITGEDPSIETALIHVKNNTFQDEGDYYGRPAALGIMTWLYVDFQQGNLQSRLAASEIISKKLLAFEGEDPNALRNQAPNLEEGTVTDHPKPMRQMTDFQANMLVLKGIATNMEAGSTTLGPKDGVSSIAGIKYPHGGKPPVVIDIEMNRDTVHQEMQIQRASSVICSSLGWAPELIGSRPLKASLGGGSQLYDTLVMKSVSTVETRQNFWQNIWNSVIGEICEAEDKNGEFKSIGIDYPDNIEKMLMRFTLSHKSGDTKELLDNQNEINDEDLEVEDVANANPNG
jgi:hypothetical protein